MAKYLLSKCALITGSTSGLGLGIAKSLAAHGANVVLNGFGDLSVINSLVDSFKCDYNVDAIYSNADMTQPEQIRSMIRDTVSHFGRLDILVNNAGVQHVAPLEAFDVETFEKIIKVNLSAPFYAIQAVFPVMKKQKYGRIINVSSVHGLVASVNKVPYVSSKHGVIGMTKAVALEGTDFGITCNALCPGWVLTSMVEKQIERLAEQEKVDFETAAINLLKAKQPLARFVTPEEAGDAVAFLCGPSSNSITGIALEISGGWTIH